MSHVSNLHDNEIKTQNADKINLIRYILQHTGSFIMFSVITNIYNKKTEGPTLMELFTATGKLKKFFLTTRDVRCVHHE
jgi:uncharacterized protein with PQ loop repeat